MTRKDGRPLVTEFPVTAMDRIDYTMGSLPLSADALVCSMRREPVDESWMDPDEGPGYDGDWGA